VFTLLGDEKLLIQTKAEYGIFINCKGRLKDHVESNLGGDSIGCFSEGRAMTAFVGLDLQLQFKAVCRVSGRNSPLDGNAITSKGELVARMENGGKQARAVWSHKSSVSIRD